MNHLDISDLIERCEKRLFLNEFDDSDNMNHESIIDELWYNAHNRLDSILPKDLGIIERSILHNQLEQHFLDLKYIYCVDQFDNWIHDTYLTDDQISERKYKSLWKKVKSDPRHITNVSPELFRSVPYDHRNFSIK